MFKGIKFYFSNEDKFKKKLLFFVCLVFFAHSLNVLSYGFNNPIMDSFAFRQAQTAITSFWFIEEGYKLNYITPVLGPPWSIPFEFPIYQYIVSFLKENSGLSLDQSGRLVSIISYYISTITLFFLFRALKFSTTQSLIPVLFFLSSPFYLFWSRTFMMESMALAFGLLSLLFFIKNANDYKIKYLSLVIVFGVLSALTKVTTFGICLTFTSLMFLFYFFERRRNLICTSYLKLFTSITLIIFIPLTAAIIWNNYADFVKEQNSLATFILSKNLVQWNFGTFEQKIALKTWMSVFQRIELITGFSGFVLLGLISFISKKTFWIALFSVLAFLTGPLVFTNLYIVHEYYFYANSVFLLLFMSLGVIALLEYNRVYMATLIVLLVILVMQGRYYNVYPNIINGSQANPLYLVGNAVKENTNKSDVLLIYGSDWDSSIPYYAERKSIMDRGYSSLVSDEIQEALNIVDKENIGAVLLCEYVKSERYDESFRKKRIDYFNLELQFVTVGICDIYYRKL